MAEEVYRVLCRDNHFWREFYRVKAYYLDLAGGGNETKFARLKALSVAQEMLAKSETRV